MAALDLPRLHGRPSLLTAYVLDLTPACLALVLDLTHTYINFIILGRISYVL